MQEVIIKGKEFETIREVHEYLAEELNFPGYYGKNLSALYDVLTEICDDTKVIMDLTDMEDEQMAELLEHMLEVMTDAADANHCFEVESVTE